jgi:hypothetical protein
MLVWAGWRGWRWPRLAASAALWIALALLPTAIVFAAYAAQGQAQTFLVANVLSIVGRGQDLGEATFRLAKVLVALIPFYVALWIGWRRAALCPQGMMARRGVLLWLGMAVIGFLAPGTWYDHYVAPALMPLAILAAPALDGRCRVTGWLRRGLSWSAWAQAWAPPPCRRTSSAPRPISTTRPQPSARISTPTIASMFTRATARSIGPHNRACPRASPFPPTFPRGLKNMRWASIQPPKWRGSWPAARRGGDR